MPSGYAIVAKVRDFGCKCSLSLKLYTNLVSHPSRYSNRTRTAQKMLGFDFNGTPLCWM